MQEDHESRRSCPHRHLSAQVRRIFQRNTGTNSHDMHSVFFFFFFSFFLSPPFRLPGRRRSTPAGEKGFRFPAWQAPVGGGQVRIPSRFASACFIYKNLQKPCLWLSRRRRGTKKYSCNRIFLLVLCVCRTCHRCVRKTILAPASFCLLKECLQDASSSTEGTQFFLCRRSCLSTAVDCPVDWPRFPPSKERMSITDHERSASTSYGAHS